MSPTPPGGGPPLPPNAGSVFLSYKLRCGKQPLPALALEDQFGATSLTPSIATELLVPALPGPPNDHFACYKTKDPRAKVRYAMDLVAGVPGFADERGCTIKLGAKWTCMRVTKTNVVPPPPGGGPGPGPDSDAAFLSYKLDCPKGAASFMSFADQFGVGSFRAVRPKMLLVPAN